MEGGETNPEDLRKGVLNVPLTTYEILLAMSVLHLL